MLGTEEKEKIDHEIGHYPNKRAASIEALKIVQEKHGWVSDDHLREIATILETSPEDLEGVATFYNLIFRRPVGRHVILTCDSVSCWVMGYKKLASYFKEKLGVSFGETTDDGRFTLLSICCLGTCDRAPAFMIDGDLHRNVDASDTKSLDSILERYE